MLNDERFCIRIHCTLYYTIDKTAVKRLEMQTRAVHILHSDVTFVMLARFRRAGGILNAIAKRYSFLLLERFRLTLTLNVEWSCDHEIRGQC